MGDFECDLDAKFFHALLNGLVKMLFLKDKTITHQYLVDQLFGSSKMESDAINALVNSCTKALQMVITNQFFDPVEWS